MASLSEILQKRAPVLNSLDPDATVADAVRAMVERQVGAVLVIQAGRLHGIFSERDVVHRVVARGLSVEKTPLREVMTPRPATAAPGDDRTTAILKMQAAGCRHLPIASGGDVVDMVSMRDLLFAELDEREFEIRELRRYVQGG